MEYSTLQDKQNLIRTGKLSLIDNYQSYKNRIQENSDLNAYLSVFEPKLDDLQSTERKIIEGENDSLAGLIISIKDVLALEGERLTCASKILENYESIYTATVVQKLIDSGAIINGKTNCDEFAMGSSNENSAFGPVKNPVDKTRVPGGSSGGSAAAVATDLCDASIGTDTGGSIRQPAAFCGVYGLKPTYGRVSRFGLTAFASSFDSIGPITKNVTDAALILKAIAGRDEKDSTSADVEVPDYPSELQKDKKFTVALPVEYFSDGLDKEISDRINEIIDWLKSNGHNIIQVSLKHTQYAIATYYVLTTAEASSNLARYDGVRFGYRSADANTLNDLYVNSREEAFGAEVKRRIMLGTYVLSAGYYDAYYRKAQRVRRLVQNDFKDVFKNADLILAPTTPTAAFKLGEMMSDPLQMYLNDIYTTSTNLAGIPAMNIPMGKNSDGLPIGFQLMANHFNESHILNLAYQLEQGILTNL